LIDRHYRFGLCSIDNSLCVLCGNPFIEEELMISKDQKKYLRTLLHTRNIVIWIGQNGLTENVMTEVESALDHHELIKIRVRTGDSSQRDVILEKICEKTGAEPVQKIGSVVSVYRRNSDQPVIRFPL